ncbi:MAG TPA: acyl-CoA desaturase [Chthoniobacter sp.]|nr:acyl-CoA desaturase [Chthoniobacter sp.]
MINKAVPRALVTMRQWVDSDYFPEGSAAVRERPDRFELRRCVPFFFLHLGCLAVIWVGWSPAAVAVAAALYFVRMFAITGFYHRFFSHRTFRTSRGMQFIFAVLGNTAVQRGALWWAAVHRHHHKHADQTHDVHSPGLSGFWWAHIGWMTSSKNFPTDYDSIRDLARYPELVFLNRFDLLVPACFGASLYALGALLHMIAPGLSTSGGQMFVWGFFISTVVLLHGTLFINSLAHVFGSRRFATEDDSRNNFLLALVTLGEGWHNNHHRYMGAARQGFYWWEIDVTFYVLKVLAWSGLIWELKPVPRSVLEEVARPATAAQAA